MTPSLSPGARSRVRRIILIGILAVITAIGVFAGFVGEESGQAKWIWRIVATVAVVMTTILSITMFSGDGGSRRPKTSVGIAYAPADQPWADWLQDRVVASDNDALLMPVKPGTDVAVWAAETKALARPTVMLLSAVSALPEYELSGRLDSLRQQKKPTLVAQVEAHRFGGQSIRSAVDADVSDHVESAEAYSVIRSALAARQVDLPPAPASAAEGHRFPNSGPVVELRRPALRTFVGRDDVLEKLFRALVAPPRSGRHHCAVLFGAHGMGKTQTAVEYAERFRARYDVIWWISANSSGAISHGLLALARTLGLAETADLQDLIHQLWRELGRRGRWLLVFDDAPDLPTLRPYWPVDANGDVLVTSSHRQWSEVADARVAVDELPHDDAIQLLRRRLDAPDDVLEAISETWTRAPFWLNQAALYYEEVDLPLASFLRLSPVDALTRARQPSERQELQTLLDRVNRLATTAPDAHAILVQLCYFDLSDMPRAVPQEFAVALPERVRGIVLDELRFGQCLARLANESYVELDPDAIRLHRLVQLAVRQSVSRDRQEEGATGAVDLLLAAFPADPAHPVTWPRCGRLLPHVMAATACAGELKVAGGQSSRLLGLAARYLQRRGEWDEARTVYARAIALAERAQPPDDGRLADLLYGLGRLRYHMAVHAEARDLVGRALALHEIVDSGGGPRVAEDLATLASIAREQARFDEAVGLYERAIDVGVRALGPEHPTVARHLDALGILHWRMGHMASAEEYLRNAEIGRRAAGPDCRADLGSTLKHLGMTHRDVGRLEEAIGEMEESRRLLAEELGPDHIDTVATEVHLADALTLSGRYLEAAQMFDHAELVRAAAMAPDHGDRAEVHMKRGFLLRETGHLGEAERELTRADEIFRMAGEEHPYRAETFIGLGLVRADQGRLDEAADLLDRAKTIFDRTYGPVHVFQARTLAAQAHLARLRGDSGQATALEAEATKTMAATAAA